MKIMLFVALHSSTFSNDVLYKIELRVCGQHTETNVIYNF